MYYTQLMQIKELTLTFHYQYSIYKTIQFNFISLHFYVRRRAGIEMELASKTDQRVLRWFGHVERIDEYRMSRRVLMAEVSGVRVRERPSRG